MDRGYITAGTWLSFQVFAERLYDTADAQCKLGRYGVARTFAEEALQVVRRLAEEDPSAHNARLVKVLRMCSHILGKLGQSREEEMMRVEADEIEKGGLVADEVAGTT